MRLQSIQGEQGGGATDDGKVVDKRASDGEDDGMVDKGTHAEGEGMEGEDPLVEEDTNIDGPAA